MGYGRGFEPEKPPQGGKMFRMGLRITVAFVRNHIIAVCGAFSFHRAEITAPGV